MSDSKSFTLPAGVYFLGDPSYVLKEDDYDTLLNDDNGSLFKTGLTELHGRKLFVLGDGPGDGSYKLEDTCDDDDEEIWQTNIPVDSGAWVVMPVELCTDDETTEDDLYKYGHLIDASDVEDENGPLKEFDVDVNYVNGLDEFPSSVEILFYKLFITEEP